MANRRMFSRTITSSSAFLMMPLSSQGLYLQIGQNSDDDGYCEYFGIMRMCGAQPDDLKLLAVKGFVHVFDDKVLLVKDWKENNYIQTDRYHKSKYLDVYNTDTERIQDVYKMDTEVRVRLELGKDRANNSYVAEATEDIEEMKSLWRTHTGTQLRNHLEENLRAFIYLKGELGAELPQYLQAVRMLRADMYQPRKLQGKLINYAGLKEKIEEVEAYMQGRVDKNVVNSTRKQMTSV